MSSDPAHSVHAAALEKLELAGLPCLDDRQIGHVRHIENLSLQLENDWSHMMGRNPLQEDFGAYRFQLAYMSLALALAHFHRLPAAPGLFKNTFDRLIQKMLLPEVWSYWRDVSKGGNWLARDAPRGDGWIDPVSRDNIMYSAYVQTMTLLYNVLFDDDKYAQPGAITFRFEPLFWNVDRHQVFAYDQNSLNERVYWNMVESGYLGVACEPYCVFLICNQVPILGFRLHDVLTGGSRAQDVTRGYLRAWEEFGGFLDASGHFNAAMRSHAREVIPGLRTPWVDAWCGTLMNAWNRDFVRDHYPQQIQDLVCAAPDGTLSVRMPSPPTHLPAELPPAMGRLEGSYGDFGWVATWASEMGDEKTLAGLLAHAERHMSPTWQADGLYYPRNDQLHNEAGHLVGMTPLVGNALLAYARLNVNDGLWTLYNRPWGRGHFEEPALVDISPNLDVLRACFDGERRRLIFTLRLRADRSGEAMVRISNVWDRGPWTLSGEGVALANSDGHSVVAHRAEASRHEQYLRLCAPLDRPTTFVLAWPQP